MYKTLWVLTITLLLGFSTFAQQKVEVPLEKEETLLDIVDLQAAGFIIKTGKVKTYTKSLDWQLRYYAPQLDLVWKVPVETSQMNKGLGEDIIASPSGSYVYHLENRGYNSFVGTSNIQVTQIKNNGQAKVYTLDKETLEKIEGEEEISLCNEESFYMLTLEEGDQNTAPQLWLNRFSHRDFSFSKVKAELPFIADDKSTSTWEYAGHNSKHIWLVSKVLSDKRDAYQCQLIAVDWQGKIAQKVVLNTQVDGQYVRPSLNYKHCPGTKFLQDRVMTARSYDPLGTSQSYYFPSNSAWANVLVDESQGILYTYGLYGKKKLITTGAHADGFYLTAYDMQGKQLWQQVSSANDPLLEDKYFQKRLLVQDRTTLACLTADHNVKLQFGSLKNIYTYEFSKEGKKLIAYSNAFEEKVGFNSFFLCFSPSQPAQKYYQSHASRKKSYYGSTSAEGDVLIEQEERNKLSLLHW